MEDKSGSKLVKAKVPLSEMFGYVTDLRTMSSGRATSTMEFFAFENASYIRVRAETVATDNTFTDTTYQAVNTTKYYRFNN